MHGKVIAAVAIVSFFGSRDEKSEGPFMPYRKLRGTGLRVSPITLECTENLRSLSNSESYRCIEAAWRAGVICFEGSEACPEALTKLGKALTQLRIKQGDVVISLRLSRTAGGGPNESGFSRKHILEAAVNALTRLDRTYVDIIILESRDPDTPLEETVRAMSQLVASSRAYYWGTRGWSPEDIRQAMEIAKRENLIAPVLEQLPAINLDHKSVTPAVVCGFGFSPGAESGLASSKLGEIATSLKCTLAQLTLAWSMKQQYASILLPVTQKEALVENLKVVSLLDQLTPEVVIEISRVMTQAPAISPSKAASPSS